MELDAFHVVVDVEASHVGSLVPARFSGHLVFGVKDVLDDFPFELIPVPADDPVGIGNVVTNGQGASVPMAYFTPNVFRLTAPQKGVNIVRMSDGTTKKVLLK